MEEHTSPTLKQFVFAPVYPESVGKQFLLDVQQT